MNYLIVGSSSIAGQAAAKAAREYAPESYLIGTSSGARKCEFADESIANVDLSRADAVRRVLDGVGTRDIQTVFFAPSAGPVGYPADRAKAADIAAALAFSSEPIQALQAELNCRVVAFSSFYWLPHISVAYGSMTAVKREIERRAIAEPDRFSVIRSGVFLSKSLRAISLLIRRELRSTDDARLQELTTEWQASGRNFQDFFLEYSTSTEAKAFADRFSEIPFRATTRADIQRAVLRLLRGAAAPLQNIIGDWVWDEYELPPLSERDRIPLAKYWNERASANPSRI